MNDWLLAFTLGNAAILTNACLLPLYPGLIAFLAGNANNEKSQGATAWLGVLVLAGILTMMTLIGLVLSLVSASFGDILPIVLPIIYTLVIALGIAMLMGRNPFATLETIEAPVLSNPYATAYTYGLLFGPMTLPCTGPIILSAFTVGTGAGDVLGGLAYFFFFGLGFGWPLVILPLIALPIQRRVVGWLAKNHDALNHASGMLLIAVGIFGILTELVPQLWVSFYLNQAMQIGYWIVALLITIAIGYRTYRATHKAKKDNLVMG